MCLFLITFLDDWLTLLLSQKSVVSQLKAEGKIWQIRSLLQKKLHYKLSHSLATAFLQVLKIL